VNPLNVLVVDDVLHNLSLLEQFLNQSGYKACTAATGQQAVDVFQAEQPDIVLMDVMLPDISGIEATRRIRELAGDRWVPILFISALGQSEDMVRGLEAGGDDYLTKPVDLALLGTKIKAMQRIADMQAQLAETAKVLALYRNEAEREQETAQTLMDLMIRAASTEDPGVKMWLEPATRFSGDLMVANRSRFGHLYVLHADSMGHGLTAALPLLPISQIFSTMSERGITLPVIVYEMNASLRKQIPRGFFVSITLACIDRRNRVVEVWNGGNPPALLVNAAGEVLRRFESRQVPLGILAREEFVAETEIWQLQEDGASLVLYSDGLAEARDADKQPFGEERVMQALRQDGDRHAALISAIRQHLGREKGHDDISLISAECS
jgi:two-component system, HptB-dependent secretion and biofilm response regulator